MANYSCISCIVAVLLGVALASGERSASLEEWRRERNRVAAWRRNRSVEPHEPDSRGASEAGGAGGVRGRPCGVGEHTDGRWVAKSAGEMEVAPPPCCKYDVHNGKTDPQDREVCGAKPPPWMADTPDPRFPGFWKEWSFFAGRSDFLVHSCGNSCTCWGWEDKYLHPTPYTIHPTPHTLHPTHPTP